MLRRTARLRRSYLYKKSLEGSAAAAHAPTPLQAAQPPAAAAPKKGEKRKRKDEGEADASSTAGGVDDEYALAGVQDPRLLLTTSRDPSSRLTQFIKELRLVFPNSQRLNRGNAVVKELVEAARSNDFSDLIIVHEHRGEPDGLIISHLPYGPTAYFGLSNVVLRHDLTTKLGTMSEQNPHLIMENFQTKLGERVATILKSLFPVPKVDSRRVMTFANRDDTISFRQHVYTKTGHNTIDMGEVGPRFEAKLYQIKLGTVDMLEAESEWVLRPYMNTAKKRKAM